MLSILQVLHFVNNRDANAPTSVGRLANPHGLLVAVLLPVANDLLILIRQNEGQRCEVVDRPVQVLHLVYYPSQVPFRTNGTCFWDVHKLLKRQCSFIFTQRRSIDIQKFE